MSNDAAGTSAAKPDPATGRKRIRRIVIAYPFGLLLMGVLINVFLFGVAPLKIALPAVSGFAAAIASLALLLINHGWLMTTTELTRLTYELRATPEEWRESGLDPAGASEEGLRELERRHNAHRNTGENVVYFGPLALLFLFASPPLWASIVWLAGFGVARLGYTYAYLTRNTSLRGACMSLSLLAIFGLASYSGLALARLYSGV